VAGIGGKARRPHEHSIELRRPHRTFAPVVGRCGRSPPISVAASHHGDLRRKQGYSVAMVVEESRLLQVCLFSTLHMNNKLLNYENLLPDVVTIGDEVDAQLKQQMLRYMAANAVIFKSRLH
jgi:hypothetical protein